MWSGSTHHSWNIFFLKVGRNISRSFEALGQRGECSIEMNLPNWNATYVQNNMFEFWDGCQLQTREEQYLVGLMHSKFQKH